MLNIALIEPEIPQNTGNISRTCAVVGARLHLVGPLGFSVDEKHVRRAGLDYWDKLEIFQYGGTADFFEKNARAEMFFFSTKAERLYTQARYPDEAFLVFGRETRGLDEANLRQNPERTVRIPMRGSLRSLNLSNSVAIAVYEALRQQGFSGLV